MFNFTPSTIPNNVFVIGAGGTGGRLIPMLSQFMRSITRGVSTTGWLESPRIWLIDDDIVEQKNILRQNFIERDVSKHKAAVLAERYTKAYGVDIVPMMHRVTSDGANTLKSAVNDYLYIKNNNRNTTFETIVPNSIVVICVDSVQARRDILNVFIASGNPVDGSAPKTFFIDAGNEDNFGQVTFFTPTIVVHRPPPTTDREKERDEKEVPKLCPVSADVDFIPMDVDYYRDLVDTPAQGSCADLNQTLAINAIMATTIMGVMQNYFYRKPMSYCGVSLSLNGGNYTTHNTYADFNRRGTSRVDFDKYMSGCLVKEKDNSHTRLTFPARCQTMDATALRTLLAKKIAAEKAEQERLIRLAAAKAAEEALAAQIKEIAIRKRAELKAALAEREAHKRAVDAAVAAGVEVPLTKLEAAVKKSNAKAAPAVAMPPVVPALVATPRAPRVARNVVELTVPTAWTNVVGEDAEDEDLIDA